jgi:hypothetical protein
MQRSDEQQSGSEMKNRQSVREPDPRPLAPAECEGSANRSRRWFSRSRLSHPVASLALVLLVLTGVSAVVRRSQQAADYLDNVVTTLQRFCAGSPALHRADESSEAGRHGYRNPTIRYPAKLVEIVIRGHRDNRDILASFDALDRAWREECPDHRLAIRFVYPPSLDPFMQGRAGSWPDSSEPVDRENFERMLPVLEDLRDLILASQDNQTGRGRLLVSGYPAEPWPDSTADIQRSGPALGDPQVAP